MTRFIQTLLPCCLACGLLAVPESAPAALVLTYDVNIVEAGPVTVGSTINWEVFATVSGAPDVGENFGIQRVSVTLGDSFGETMSTGTVSQQFVNAAPGFTDGGTYNPGNMRLELIGAFDLLQDQVTVGVMSTGSFLIASGSYMVTQQGTHTLQAFDTGDASSYFTAASQAGFAASPYDNVLFGSDTIDVQAAAVPEPASLAMMGLAACGALGLRRRRRGESVSTTEAC